MGKPRSLGWYWFFLPLDSRVIINTSGRRTFNLFKKKILDNFLVPSVIVKNPSYKIFFKLSKKDHFLFKWSNFSSTFSKKIIIQTISIFILFVQKNLYRFVPSKNYKWDLSLTANFFFFFLFQPRLVFSLVKKLPVFFSWKLARGRRQTLIPRRGNVSYGGYLPDSTRTLAARTDILRACRPFETNEDRLLPSLLLSFACLLSTRPIYAARNVYSLRSW